MNIDIYETVKCIWCIQMQIKLQLVLEAKEPLREECPLTFPLASRPIARGKCIMALPANGVF